VVGDGPPGEPPGDGDDLIAQFVRWSAGERVAEAARGRVRERSLREQAAQAATWTGALVDLAEAGARVTVLIGATRVAGRLEALGADFCVLQADGRRPLLVPLDRMAAVWPSEYGWPSASGWPNETGPERAPAGSTTGSRFPSLQLSMTAAMALLAEERHPVTLVLTGGHQVQGDLVRAGEDVLTVRELDGRARSVLVALEHVEYCLLR